MFYHLLPPLAEFHIFFNLFNYLTIRSAGAGITAFLVAFLAGPAVIRTLRRKKVGQPLRSELLVGHEEKIGTPTMGGLLILFGATLSTLLWAELTNPYVLITLISFLFMGGIGFMDDYLKVVRKNPEGLVERYKVMGQVGFSLLLAAFLLLNPIHPVPTTWTMVAKEYSGRAAAVVATMT